MNGSSLLGFIITLIVLFAIGAIFFLTIDRVVKDGFLAKIAKIVIGCLILIAFVLAIAGVLGLGGGGLAASPQSIVVFAVGVLVLIVVLYLVELFLGWIAGNMGIGGPIVEAPVCDYGRRAYCAYPRCRQRPYWGWGRIALSAWLRATRSVAIK